MRKAYIRRTLEDGSIEEVEVIVPDKTTAKSKRKRTVKKPSKETSDEDNKKQEEKQVTKTSKANIGITRSKG